MLQIYNEFYIKTIERRQAYLADSCKYTMNFT